MKILRVSNEGLITKVNTTSTGILEINDIVQDRLTKSIFRIDKFIGDNDEDVTLFAQGETCDGTEHSINIRYLHIYRLGEFSCNKCENYCTKTGKKILK